MLEKKKTIIVGVGLTIMLASVLGLGGNYLVVRHLAGRLVDQYGQQELTVADTAAQSMEDSIVGLQEKLRLLAESPEIKTGSAAVCTQKIQAALGVMDTKIGNLGRVDVNGYFKCSVNQALVGVKAETLGSYITQIFNDPEHKPVMSRAIKPAGATSYLVAVHVPVYSDKGQFLGTLGGAVYLDDLQKKYLHGLKAGRTGYVALLDDNGDILYTPRSHNIGKNINDAEVREGLGNNPTFFQAVEAAKAGQRGTVRYAYQGAERIAAYRAAEVLDGRKWLILVVVPVADAMQTLRDVGVEQAFWALLGILFVSVLLVGAMMLLVLLRSLQLRRAKDEMVRLLEAEKMRVEAKVAERTQALSEAQSQLTASIGSLPFGFAVLDQVGNVVLANPMLGTLMGGPLEKAPREFTAVLDVAAVMGQVREQRQPVEQNIAVGSKFFRVLVVPVLAGAEVLGTVFLLEDKTEAKALERSREEFFSIASHELRTPLTAIMGNTDILQEYYRDKLRDPEVQAMVADMHEASVRLIEIVNDFLDMWRLEQEQMVFDKKPVPVATVLQELRKKYQLMAANQGLKLIFELKEAGSIVVRADERQFKQILTKLLNNALHFAEHGKVTVRVKPAGEMVQVVVQDTGKGIPVKAQHLLFHKFQQATEKILTRDSTHSAGLGLYISRLRAEGMGGRLYLEETQEGEGSTFVLELPAAD